MSTRGFAIGTLAFLILASFTLAADAPRRLGYQQEQALKDARYYLDQIENLIANIEQRTKQAVPGDASIQAGKLQSWIQWKDQATKYMTNVETRLKQLPADHPQVKEQADRAAQYTKSLDEQTKKLEALQKGVGDVLAKGEGAEYQADFDRLKEINKTFANPQVIKSNPEQAIEIIRQMAPAKAERQRLVEKYADLLKQDSSRNLQGVINYFDQVYPPFEKAVQDFAASAPAAIDKDITEAMNMAKDAVANQKPLFFGEQGGVKQRLDWAKTKLDVFTAIDEQAASASKQKLASARDEIAKMRESLNDAIIAANNPPPDQYNGPDKQQLIALVKEKWATSGVDAPVLKVGINSRDWQRSTRWVWHGASRSWNKEDASKIQGHVIVRLDNNLAAVHYVNLVKDHLKNDQIEAFFFNDPKAPLEVNDKLAAGKVK